MDPRSGYREVAPPPAVRDALACFWVRVVPPDGGPPTRILPDACVDLIWASGVGAFVAGPDTRPMLSPAAGGTVFVGARFLPGAGGTALGHPLYDIRDARVDIDDLLPELSHWIPPTLSPRVAFRRVAAAAARLAASRPPDAAVQAAARRLEDPHARLPTLADDLGLSERQLRRRCHAAVGYGPKTLQRVLRFRSFLRAVDADCGDPDLGRIAFDTGYADQAHLTRDCAVLAGLPPAALVRARLA